MSWKSARAKPRTERLGHVVGRAVAVVVLEHEADRRAPSPPASPSGLPAIFCERPRRVVARARPAPIGGEVEMTERGACGQREALRVLLEPRLQLVGSWAPGAPPRPRRGTPSSAPSGAGRSRRPCRGRAPAPRGRGSPRAPGRRRGSASPPGDGAARPCATHARPICRRSSAVSSMRPARSALTGVPMPHVIDDEQQRARAAGTAAAARAASVDASSSRSPQRVQLGDRRDDLVVGVAELVAARAEVLVAHLVDGDLDRRADELGDDLPVGDVVGPRGAEIAGRRPRRRSGSASPRSFPRTAPGTGPGWPGSAG